MYERLLGMDLASLCPQVSPKEIGSCAFSDTVHFCSHLPHNPIELRDFHKRGRNQEPDRGILKLKCLLNHRWPRLEVHPRNRCQLLLSALRACAVCVHQAGLGSEEKGLLERHPVTASSLCSSPADPCHIEASRTHMCHSGFSQAGFSYLSSVFS